MIEQKTQEPTLEERISYALQHCVKHKFNAYLVQCYIGDAFIRFIRPYKNDTLSMVDVIKSHAFDQELMDRYNYLIIKYKLESMTESNRLLLIKAVYIEKKYRSPKNQ